MLNNFGSKHIVRNPYLEIKFLKEADYIGYVTTELSKYAKFSIQVFPDFVCRVFFKTKKIPGTRFQATFLKFLINIFIFLYYSN